MLNMSDTNKTVKKKKDMNTVTDTISPLYPSLKGVDPGLDVPLPYPNPTAARKRPTGGRARNKRARENLHPIHRHPSASVGAELSAFQAPTEGTTERDADEDEADAFPMIQVATQGGVGVLYRPWTETDIRRATSHLPPCKDSGAQFAHTCQVSRFGRESPVFYPSFPPSSRISIFP